MTRRSVPSVSNSLSDSDLAISPTEIIAMTEPMPIAIPETPRTVRCLCHDKAAYRLADIRAEHNPSAAEHRRHPFSGRIAVRFGFGRRGARSGSTPGGPTPCPSP